MNEAATLFTKQYANLPENICQAFSSSFLHLQYKSHQGFTSSVKFIAMFGHLPANLSLPCSPQINHHTICQSKLKAFTANARAGMRVDSMKNKNPSTLYQVLCISETASLAEIKAAYRNLAKTHHPDSSPDTSDAQEFIEIHNAYATLSNPTARARYDTSIGANHRLRYALSTTGSGFRITRRWETDQCW